MIAPTREQLKAADAAMKHAKRRLKEVRAGTNKYAPVKPRKSTGHWKKPAPYGRHICSLLMEKSKPENAASIQANGDRSKP